VQTAIVSLVGGCVRSVRKESIVVAEYALLD
jgi:hypothetical protein